MFPQTFDEKTAQETICLTSYSNFCLLHPTYNLNLRKKAGSLISCWHLCSDCIVPLLTPPPPGRVYGMCVCPLPDDPGELPDLLPEQIIVGHTPPVQLMVVLHQYRTLTRGTGTGV